MKQATITLKVQIECDEISSDALEGILRTYVSKVIRWEAREHFYFTERGVLKKAFIKPISIGVDGKEIR